MPLFPPDDQYAQRKQGAFIKHVADKFRAESPDLPADATDDDVLRADYLSLHDELGAEAPDPENYMKFIQKEYGADFKAPGATVGETVGPIAHGLAKLPGAIAHGFAAPVLAARNAGEGRHLTETMEGMPRPDIESLRQRGFTEAAIHNIVKGYTDTQQSLSEDIVQQGQEGVRNTVEGAVNYGLLPLGVPGAKGAHALLQNPIGRAAAHAAVGALGGAVAGGLQSGIEAGAEVDARGGNASEIWDAQLKAGLPAAGAGALIGGVLGGVLGSVGEGIHAKWSAARATREEATKAATRAGMLANFKESFQPEWLRDRFGVDLDAAAAAGQTDDVIAQGIVSKLTGGATPDPEMVAIIADKVKAFRALPPANRGPGRLPSATTPHPFPDVALPRQTVMPGLDRGALPPGSAVSEPGLTMPHQDIGPSTSFVPEGSPPIPDSFPIGYRSTVEGAPPPAGFERTGVPTPVPPDQLTVTPRAEPPTGGLPSPEGRAYPTPLGQENLPGQPLPTEMAVPPNPAERGPAPKPLPVAGQTGAVRPLPPEVPPAPKVAPIPAPAGTMEPVTLNAGPKAPVPPVGVEAVEPRSLTPGPGEDAARSMRALGQPVSRNAQDISRKVGGVEYRVKPLASNKGVELEHLQNFGKTKGEGAQVLAKLTEVADAADAPIEVTALPLPMPGRKGVIPQEKLNAFYKSHGFEVIDEATGRMRREPKPKAPLAPEAEAAIGQQGPGIAPRIAGLEGTKVPMAAGNVTEGSALIQPKPGGKVPALAQAIGDQLDLFAEAAEKRMTQRRLMKDPEMLSGPVFDPSQMKDAVIVGAAKMYSMGLRSYAKFSGEMVRLFGDGIKPVLPKVFEQARTHLMKALGNHGVTRVKMNQLLQLAEEGKLGADWYNHTRKWLNENFGDDAEMMARFIAATSMGKSTDANATFAMKAYAQWKLGLPFDGYDKNIRKAMERAVRGEVFGSDKVQGYLGALLGDENAIALDRWMIRALGFESKFKSNLTAKQYQLFGTIIRDLAKQAGMTPREFQAAVWIAVKMGKARAEKAAGRIGKSNQGSMRPMEALIGRRLEGKTPLQWVDDNQVRLSQIKNAQDGIAIARQPGSGYTFDPFTYKKWDKPGYVVTLMSKKIPTNDLTPTELINFRKNHKKLIEQYPGLSIGTFDIGKVEGSETPMISMDLNMHLPSNMDEAAIAKLGLDNRQHAVGHIDEGGNYREIGTGYDPAAHGEQSLQPKESKMIASWRNKEMKRVAGLIEAVQPAADAARAGSSSSALSGETLDAMVRNPATAFTEASAALGKSVDELKHMADAGTFRPMTEAGVANGLKVQKDGTVWQYIDPVGPSYNTMKVFGSFRSEKAPELLRRMEAFDIISGHEHLDKFRGEVGAMSFRRFEPAAAPQVAKATSAMMELGGQVIPVKGLTSEKSRYLPRSLWLTPTGRLIESKQMTHHRQALAILKKIGGKPVKVHDEHETGGAIQALTNMGFVRVQHAGGSVGIDVAAHITPQQRAILRQLIDGASQWAAQISDEKGNLVNSFNNDKIHHFLAQAGGN